MTTAAGTVTLSEMKSTAPTTTFDVHLYTKLYNREDFGLRNHFDTSLFYNTEEFTMRFNEQHKMLVEGFSLDRAESIVYRARLVNDELSIDMEHEPGQLCYAITLLTPDVTLTVGPRTSLSLLLNSAQLRVTMYTVTADLAAQLKRPLQERDLVRSQVNTIRQAALDGQVTPSSHEIPRDPRKRKAATLDTPPSGPVASRRPLFGGGSTTIKRGHPMIQYRSGPPIFFCPAPADDSDD